MKKPQENSNLPPQPEEVAELDQHHGMGGSYVADPITGKRTLVERTATTESKEKE